MPRGGYSVFKWLRMIDFELKWLKKCLGYVLI
jgi:hypothetical protein